MIDGQDYDASKTNHYTDNSKLSTTAAKTLFRFDGSGYVACGNLAWDETGTLNVKKLYFNNGKTIMSLDDFFKAFTVGIVDSNPRLTPNYDFSALTVRGATLIDSTLKVTGAATLSAGLTVTGDIIANGGITIGDIKVSYDSANGALALTRISDSKALASLYATGGLAAYGAGSGTSGGGTSYNRLDKWSDYTTDKATYVLSALLGNDLNTRVSKLENSTLTSVDWSIIDNKPSTYTPSPHTHAWADITDHPIKLSAFTNDAAFITASAIPTKLSAFTNDAGFVTSIGWSDITNKPSTFTPSAHTHLWADITDAPTKLSQFTNDSGFLTSVDWSGITDKPSTFTPSAHTHSFGSLTSVPTTLAGYGITDANISGGVITLGANSITPLTTHQDISGKSDIAHTHTVKINGITKTIAATGGTAVDLGTYLTSHQSLSAYSTTAQIQTLMGNYLPLTGGTMTGSVILPDSFYILKVGSPTFQYPQSLIGVRAVSANAGYSIAIERNTIDEQSWIGFPTKTLNNGVDSIYIGVKYGSTDFTINNNVGNFLFNNNIVLHAGNYSSYALPLHGTADSATVASKLGRNGNSGIPMTFNWSGQSGQPSWLWGGNDGTNMYVYNPSNFNVNSAIKLATPRTLWGQSFDGTGNVDGTLTLNATEANAWPATSGSAQTGLSARFKGSDNATMDFGHYGSSGTWIQSTDIISLGTYYALLLNPNGGNVGIGTTSPAYKLDVNGTFHATGAATLGSSLTVTGNILATGGVTAYTSSDRRLKKNIRPADSLRVIRTLGGTFEFDYRKDNRHSIGFIAQNVRKSALSDMVCESAGYLRINYLDTRLISLALGASVELDDEVTKLKKKVSKLEKEVERLKAA